MANSKDFKSSTSVTTTGISCKPAFCAANHLLSPAIISYFKLSFTDFLTIIGWITPLSLIEFARSFKLSWSKIFLGWYLFGIISLKDNMKIEITGAEGTIGSVLRKGLSNKYKIKNLNKVYEFRQPI